jgi:hypothetical protein
MRPVQIALLTNRDVKVIQTSQNAESVSVHLTFKTVKQRNKSSGHPLLRKVKDEWTPLFIELSNHFLGLQIDGDARFFRVISSHEVAHRISTLAESIIGVPTNATDLRHTAAQRLVDAGANQEELAEFMGHTDVTTGLVYFQTSQTQAELVNRALGISPVYQRVIKIAHDQFISKADLEALKVEQQIAAVPHGIPISGIGGCNLGQPNCPSNPITSCYGCRKFMPLNDSTIHIQVLEDLREVVIFFNIESNGDITSPAYMQLQSTISGVQQVIQEIEDGNHA